MGVRAVRGEEETEPATCRDSIVVSRNASESKAFSVGAMVGPLHGRLKYDYPQTEIVHFGEQKVMTV